MRRGAEAAGPPPPGPPRPACGHAEAAVLFPGWAKPGRGACSGGGCGGGVSEVTVRVEWGVPVGVWRGRYVISIFQKK